jgi:teichuronic acid biosynthesis glycosyltransferase TuaH
MEGLPMDQPQYEHFIVSSTRLVRRDGIRYRRNRLAAYLAALPSTRSVTWISPRPITVGCALELMRSAAAPLPANDRIGKTREAPLYHTRHGVLGIRAVMRRHHRHALFQSAPGPGSRRVLWFTHPTLPELASLDEWDAVVYDCSDYWPSAPPGEITPQWNGRRGRLAAAERVIVTRADVLFASSSFLVDHLRSRYGKSARLIENGVEQASFRLAAASEDARLAEIPRPRLVFSGTMKSKIDFELLSGMAAARPEWSIVLLGPDSDGLSAFQALLQQPNVHWLGYVSSNQVASYLKSCDLGLLPYRDAEYNRGVFPLKLFEYLAAGLPVIGCNLPSTAGYQDQGVYSLTSSDVDSFRGRCEEALGWNSGEEKSRRARVAVRAEWSSRFREMTEMVLGQQSGTIGV